MSKANLVHFEELKKTDKVFARWMRKFDNSKTQIDYFRWFVPFCDTLGLTPQTFVDAYKAQGDRHDDFIDQVETKLSEVKAVHMGLAKQIHASMVSMLKHNGVILGSAAFEIPAPKSLTIEPEYIPSPEEFEVQLRHCQKPRDKAMFAFFRWAGPRAGAVDDPVPLTLRHLLDLNLEALNKGQIEFKHKTSCAVLIYGSFKNGQPITERSGAPAQYLFDAQIIVRTPETYVGFLLPRAMELLKEYLESRIRKGETLSPDSYLFKTESRRKKNGHLDSDTASIISSRVNKAAGFILTKVDPATKEEKEVAKYTIHGLRRLFYNTLSSIDDVDKEALMGHVKGVRARYHGTVDELPRAVEFMREKYEKGMRTESGSSDEEIRAKAILDMARTMGVPQNKVDEIERTLGRPLTIEAVRKRVQREFDNLLPHHTNGGTPFESKIVSADELLEYVNGGWEPLKELSDGRLIIRRDK
jgi:hypothetical protein